MGASGTGTDKPMAEGSRVSVSEQNGIGGKDGGSENTGELRCRCRQQSCHRYSWRVVNVDDVGLWRF